MTIPASAATFITSSITSVSSLDTGRLGYITAWGGSEFGYSYTYTLSGAPAGLSIGSTTGILSLSAPLSAGTYNFNVICTNRVHNTVSSTLPYTLTVATGVTSSRTGSQILHKTYDPHSGTWGSPSGSNWTAVFLSMQAAIQSDQVTAGEGLLHATISLHAGVAYTYTDNTWLNGIQFLDLVATAGANPTLQNTIGSATFDIQYAPLNLGSGTCFNQAVTKNYGALTQSANVGDTTLTLVNSGNASRIVAGRWHIMTGGSQQIGGFPPNITYFDYVKVVSVSGTTVTLDRPLRHAYSSVWYEDPADDLSWGKARLGSFDLGGSSGFLPAEDRVCQRFRGTGVTFLTNPNTANGSKNIVQTQQLIDCQWDRCTLGHIVPSMAAHHLYNNCTIADGEPDKTMETLIFDGATTTGGMGEGTGAEYWLSQGASTHGSLNVSPRQMRTINATLDATGDNFTIFPWVSAGEGPIIQLDFHSTTFKHGVGDNGWTPGGQSDTGNPNTPKIVIGTDATWSGARLIIPRSFAHFEDWLMGLFVGAIIATGNVPISGNWAYVSALSAPSDGSALWVDTVWTGTKPLSGSIWRSGRYHELIMGSDCTFVSPTIWRTPGFMKETSAPFGTNYDFPTGYPFIQAPPGPNVNIACVIRSQTQMRVAVPTVQPLPVVNIAVTMASTTQALFGTAVVQGPPPPPSGGAAGAIAWTFTNLHVTFHS